MIIQHNISALNSYNRLSGNNKALAKNLEKLSSGYKINRAADDAAGLAISEKMRAQITGMNRAQQNSKDGISLVQTAEGALTEVHSMLNRMVDLTTQASNGIYTDTERTKIQDELKQLESEIDRIADATNFNGIKLLDGSMGSGTKTSAKSVIETDLASEYMDATAGIFAANASLTATLDAGSKFNVSITFDDGSSKSFDFGVVKSGTTNLALTLDGETLTNPAPAGTIGAGAIETAIVDALMKDEAFAAKYTAEVNANKLIITSNETGTSTPQVTGITLNGTKSDGTQLADAVKAAATGTAAGTTTIAKDASEGIKFAAFTSFNGTNLDDATFTINGKKFIIADKKTDITQFGSDYNVIIGDITATDADEQKNIASQFAKALGMDVTAGKASATSTATDGLVFKGAGGSSGLQLQIGDTADSFNQLMVSVADCHAAAIGVSGLSVADPAVAAQSMEKAKAAIEEISKTRSLLGATQNRLDHTLANLEETTTNLTEAESRIRDTDMANEMMKYTKNNILIQSSQAMLAQANQVPQGVLQLLQ